MKISKMALSMAVIVCVLAAGGAPRAQQNGGPPFSQLPAPAFDSGWVVAEPDQSGALFSIAHPVGVGISTSLIAADIRFPGASEFSLNNWTANETEVKVGRALFSPREVRVRIWVTR